VIPAPAPGPPLLDRWRLIVRERRREAWRRARPALARELREAAQRLDPLPPPLNALHPPQIGYKVGSTMTFPKHDVRLIYTTARRWEPWGFHTFTPHPASGAGNCVCGGAERHRRHPHEPMPRASNEYECVCGVLIEDSGRSHAELLAGLARLRLAAAS
jgi:hypothetical protein